MPPDTSLGVPLKLLCSNKLKPCPHGLFRSQSSCVKNGILRRWQVMTTSVSKILSIGLHFLNALSLILYLDSFSDVIYRRHLPMLLFSRPLITKSTTQIVRQFFGQWLCLPVKYSRGCYGLLVFFVSSRSPRLCGMLRPSMTFFCTDAT